MRALFKRERPQVVFDAAAHEHLPLMEPNRTQAVCNNIGGTRTLAEDLIRRSGLRPIEDVPIVFTGARPGEKLREELLIDAEGTLPTAHPHVRRAGTSYEAPDHASLHGLVEDLLDVARAGDAHRVRAMLREAVPFGSKPQGSESEGTAARL